MQMATDNLLDDIGLNTPDTEETFRRLFFSDDPCTYTRENGAGEYKRCSPRWIWPSAGTAFRLERNVFDLATQDSGKRQGGYRFNASYKGPYRYHVVQRRFPDTVRMIYLDIDDPSIVPMLLTTPLKDQAIWNRTKTPGRYHICVPVEECRYGHAEETVYAWLQDLGIRTEYSRPSRAQVESNVIGLRSMLLPGQDEFSMPCEPGAYQKPLCETYEETKQLYADLWRYKRVPLEEIFRVKPRKKQFYEIKQVAKPSVAHKKKYIKTDIPGVGISVGCKVNGQRHDFYSVDDCLAESDGFLISCAYISALVRKHRADRYLVIEDATKFRQKLRTGNSKKHHLATLLTHVKSTAQYFCNHYDETKTRKHDPQQELADRTALIDFFLRDKRSLVHYAQRKLKIHRQEVIEKFGKEAYRDAVLTIPFLIRDIDRFNGRIASFTDKKRDEYMFADSACFMDYPTIRGSRRKRDRIVRIFRDFGIFTDRHEGKPTYDRVKRKCSRWNVCADIIERAEKRIPPKSTQEKKEGRSESNKLIPPTNIVVHSPEPSAWNDPERDKYWQCYCDPGDKSESFDEKVARMKAAMAPEV